MRSLETVIHIHCPPEKVWKILMDFQSYPEWNPFLKSIEGPLIEGENLSVTVQPPGKKSMSFTPVILKAEHKNELRWKGKFLFRGLCDGEHYFILKELPNGSTALHHGEIFSGVLTPFINGSLQRVKTGFEHMNIALKERCEGVDLGISVT